MELENLKKYHNNILKLLADLREVFQFDKDVDLGAIVSSPTECLLTMIKECESKNQQILKCDCALSGICVYEKIICDTKQECRHKI